MLTVKPQDNRLDCSRCGRNTLHRIWKSSVPATTFYPVVNVECFTCGLRWSAILDEGANHAG